MALPTTRPNDDEDFHFLWDVVSWLHPMGGHTLYDDDGQPAGSACGELNVAPYVPGIRKVLQEAAEAELDPRALYRRAVEIYDQDDAERRRKHPQWTWPAPPFEAVEPATWPPLEPEWHRTIHMVRVCAAIRMRAGESARMERLRAVLERARARGLDPEALYREAVEHCLDDTWATDRQPSPPYEDVRPD